MKRLKFQQMKNIDKGFYDLQRKLEDKKQEIKNEFEKRFKKEEQKFLTKHSLIVANLDEISNIEKVFDQDLRGEPGREQIEVDARGKPMRILASVPPVPGKDLTLTIDANLQAVAEAGLAGHRGSCVVLDPNNGDVLALASAPSYDPNWFAGRISPASSSGLLAMPPPRAPDFGCLIISCGLTDSCMT